MKLIITYDIIKNKTRSEIVDLLYFYGFIRIQKSVFIGEINNVKIDRIIKKIKNIVLDEKDSIYVFKVCNKDFKNINFFGKSINLYYMEEDFILI